ncbi:flagellar hook-basal body complex protein FliE [Pseudoflavonifractor sp. 524-17]|uniref:flagellar hook-basal body complex protein FliE n=1 Tax=Pseudoflavonifractor sp. 524-17 TaxID=2304577 RepID=UPI00137B7173|nr:flagellar hook-basal body complex protein FliE [Pseudoflavonifractor sp. 524-17]NCE66038.1 flagellar hook-basal body complex protein FliE [Pseudoflavonifractor sp. 524-17]
MIAPIERLGMIAPAKKEETALPVQSGGVSLFASVFQSAIQNVKDTDAEKVQAQYLLSTGQLDNPSTVMIAAAKNEIAVSLLIQLRNKALDAYSELTRMSI